MGILLGIITVFLLSIIVPLGARALHQYLRGWAVLIVDNSKGLRIVPGILLILFAHGLLLAIWALALGCSMDIWRATVSGGLWYALLMIASVLLFIRTEAFYIIHKAKIELESRPPYYQQFSLPRKNPSKEAKTEIIIVATLVLLGAGLLHIFPSCYAWGSRLWSWAF